MILLANSVAQVSYLAIRCFRLLARIESWATQLVSNFANSIRNVPPIG